MPVTYTNRKGREYYLCQKLTRNGRKMYYFSRQQKGEPVNEVPQGFEIKESINGKVSLVKIRPMYIWDTEIETVKSVLQKHPEARKYPLDVKSKELIIYELEGPDLLRTAEIFPLVYGTPGENIEDFVHQLEKELDIYEQFTLVLKFILDDKKNRLFRAQRMCYLGGIFDWIDIEYGQTIGDLAAKIIPTLGTDEFYDFY